MVTRANKSAFFKIKDLWIWIGLSPAHRQTAPNVPEFNSLEKCACSVWHLAMVRAQVSWVYGFSQILTNSDKFQQFRHFPSFCSTWTRYSALHMHQSCQLYWIVWLNCVGADTVLNWTNCIWFDHILIRYLWLNKFEKHILQIMFSTVQMAIGKYLHKVI